MLRKLLRFISLDIFMPRRERIFWRVQHALLEAAELNVIIEYDVEFHADFVNLLEEIYAKADRKGQS